MVSKTVHLSPQVSTICSAKKATPHSFSSYFLIYCHASSLDFFFNIQSFFSTQNVQRSHTRSLINITSFWVKKSCSPLFYETWSPCKRSCTDFVSPRFQSSVGNPGGCLHASTYSHGSLSESNRLWTVDTLAGKVDSTLSWNSQGEICFGSMTSVTSSESDFQCHMPRPFQTWNNPYHRWENLRLLSSCAQYSVLTIILRFSNL